MSGYRVGYPFVNSLLLLEQKGGPRGDCHCKSSRVPVHLLKRGVKDGKCSRSLNQEWSV
jgi:hypothetical protein